MQTATQPAQRGGVFEWFWRSRTLRSARGLGSLPLERRQRLAHARVAAELAERALDPIEPLRNGSALPLVISLYREAAFWALTAQPDAPAASSLRQAFDAAAPGLLASAAGSADALAQVSSALCDKSFIETADEPAERVRGAAERARDFVQALIRHAHDDEERVLEVLVQRWVRTSTLILLLAALGFVAKLEISRALQQPDLAQGKPWRASSQAFPCKPKENSCGGAKSAILFHTNDEKDPWFEIDLGKPQLVGRVEVRNRADCCPDRAVPLVIEVSTDQKKWRSVARRNDTFMEWTATFTPKQARYVRARVARQSTLHLERMSIRAR